MATYILFWNPDISSYTKERFLNDFKEREQVGNWSFYEHKDVEFGDTFYMVKCGQGKCGLVMRGTIESYPYESEDWSPQNRKHIYYADIEQDFTINPWSDAELITPELLTKHFPDFNWFGGHSGRKIDEVQAEKLDDIWFEYLDRHSAMFCQKEAWICSYAEHLFPERIAKKILTEHGDRCEICGYSYSEVFGKDYRYKDDYPIDPICLINPTLNRLFYNICPNCNRVEDKYLIEKLKCNGSL